MKRPLLLTLTALSVAYSLPRYGGYVNDFAGKLAPEERAELELRLRDYERATTNEVAVAIVESLDGEEIDDYARNLFRAWGIGKRDRNNGVLLLWAPLERRVRIQVGYGLEDTLSDRASADILEGVTGRFRREDWAGGLNAGVDGIIDRLSEGGEAPKSKAFAGWLTGGAAAVAFGMVLLFVAIRRRAVARSLPRDMERAAADLRGIEPVRQRAATAMEQLRKEAPEEVWSAHAEVGEKACGELSALGVELSQVRGMPQGSGGKVMQAHRALKRWTGRFSKLRNSLEAVDQQLAAYRACRENGPAMLEQLQWSLNQAANSWVRGRKAKLAGAARQSYDRAAMAAAALPVNWLFVCDLLQDAQDCLCSADNGRRFRKRNRYWAASVAASPAYILMASQAAAAGDSGFSGGDGGASFGGGDCGGGGASSSY